MEPDEDFHGQLLRRRLGADFGPQIAHQTGMMTVHQLAQGLVIARRDQRHEPLVLLVLR
jgi:hypothetical protein